MNKNELKNLVKGYFNLEDKQEDIKESQEITKEAFASGELIDGTKVNNGSDKDLEVGDSLFVETEAGETVDAPSGEHELKDGTVVVVDGVADNVYVWSGTQCFEFDDQYLVAMGSRDTPVPESACFNLNDGFPVRCCADVDNMAPSCCPHGECVCGGCVTCAGRAAPPGREAEIWCKRNSDLSSGQSAS